MTIVQKPTRASRNETKVITLTAIMAAPSPAMMTISRSPPKSCCGLLSEVRIMVCSGSFIALSKNRARIDGDGGACSHPRSRLSVLSPSRNERKSGLCDCVDWLRQRNLRSLPDERGHHLRGKDDAAHGNADVQQPFHRLAHLAAGEGQRRSKRHDCDNGNGISYRPGQRCNQRRQRAFPGQVGSG